MGIKRNSLNPLQTHHAIKALVDMKPQFDREPITLDEIARRISNQVGFTVTRGNLYATAQQLGYDFSASNQGSRETTNNIRQLLVAGKTEEAAAVAGVKPGQKTLFDQPAIPSPVSGKGITVMDQLFRHGERLDDHYERLNHVEPQVNAIEKNAAVMDGRIEKLEAEVVGLRQLVHALYRDLGAAIPS